MMTTYTIGELANLADVTPRTIRYYVSEQVLPAPDKEGRLALYNEDHLARLQLVKILKDEYLPLHEIRILLEKLDYQAVHDLLQEKQVAMEPVVDQASAKTYLQTLLNPPASEAEPPPMMRHRAAKRRLPLQPESPQPAPAQPVAGPELEAVTPSPAEDDPFAEVMKEVQKNRSKFTNSEPEPVNWRRIQLSPDVELHIRETAVETTGWPKIKKLIALAHQLLNS